MPRVKEIKIESDRVEITDQNGVKEFKYADLVSTNIADAEREIQEYFRCTDYKVLVHIFSLNPIVLSILTANPEDTTANNWWE